MSVASAGNSDRGLLPREPLAFALPLAAVPFEVMATLTLPSAFMLPFAAVSTARQSVDS